MSEAGEPLVSLRWSGVATAVSSIAHSGVSLGTHTLLRRESWIQADGTVAQVPLVSGNALRGVLRRHAERLMRRELHYAGQLPVAAAHAVRGGGVLARSAGETLSGAQLGRLRELVPVIAVFGGSLAGRVVDGILQVGKVVPYCVETAHTLPPPPCVPSDPLPSYEDLLQAESYSRADESSGPGFRVLVAADEAGQASTLMRYSVETFVVGTRFDMWLALTDATPMEAAFFTDVLAAFSAAARIGGRGAQGHGHLSLDLTPTVVNGSLSPFDWAGHLREHRDEAVDLLKALG